ncbi:hypothetical protein CKF59_00500 [Psittacicella gerlachiana]|uniref:Uncharacterized protein n=1 Tax=Psittacicella gerlachiana TaxID=2028574 RepID=A0A3A1YK61_9GAMM|nr:hypothetical protein CKF59_00500 [Psittacicella gerlachiana]
MANFKVAANFIMLRWESFLQNTSKYLKYLMHPDFDEATKFEQLYSPKNKLEDLEQLALSCKYKSLCPYFT